MRKIEKWMLAAILICGTTMVLTSCSSKDDNPVPSNPESENKAPDYSNKGSWLQMPEITKDVDAFYIYSTVYVESSFEEGAPDYATLDNPEMIMGALGEYVTNASVFEESCNVFVPWYRQAGMRYASEISKKYGNIDPALAALSYNDIKAALDYFFEKCNNGRPFVIAAHSQGAAMLRYVLKNYFKEHQDYYKRMVAAYAIGYSITKDDLEQYPYLKFAEGESDAGVIISWHTEGPNNDNNVVVLPGGISINPLNWKRDETYAPASENKGSLRLNEETGEYEIQHLDIDAQVNLARGVVVTTTKIAPSADPKFFGPASYHEDDYPFFYNNIKDNVAKRIATYKNQELAPDYSDKNNWMNLPAITKDVDVFYVYPTEYSDDSEGASTFADINDKTVREAANSTYLMQATAYEESANVFAPYYRQVNMIALATLPVAERNAALASIPKEDIFAAIDYYFKNLNGGRPFILASHSQGSVMQSFVLAEYMKAHPEYQKRMIAAYAIGYSFTEDYFKTNPHLKFAEGADDIGVIVSWNTEGPENEDKANLVVLPGAISINPLNWKRDETYASAEENLGGYIYNEKTGKLEIVPHAADAKLNLKRGVVVTTTKVMEPMPGNSAFGPASFHSGDYALYYNNIKANVATRIAAYQKSAK